MNAVALWVFVPLGAGALLLAFSARRRAALTGGAALAVLLSLAAWSLPIEQPLPLGGGAWRITAAWEFLGRSIVLDDAARPWLGWLYLGVALWLLGALWAQASPYLPAAALSSAALWVGALSVTPFVYAPGMMFIGVLVWLPALVPHTGGAMRAALRLLNLQFLAVPLLFFIGWMVTGVENLPGQDVLAVRAGLLLAVGMAFLLGVFPFHVWYPALLAEAHPYAAGMLLYFLPQVGLRLGLVLLERYAWLRAVPQTALYLQVAGGAMLLTGGLLAALERHLGRAWGYLLMADVGAALLAASLYPSRGLDIFFAAALPRLLAVFTGTLGLTRLYLARRSLRLSRLTGAAFQMPLPAAAALSGIFALSGYPLLAGFSVRLALWQALTARVAAWGGLFLAGIAGMLVIGLRAMAVMVMSGAEAPAERLPQPAGARLLLIGGLALLFLAGWFPSLFLPLARALDAFFPHLPVL